MEKDLLNIARRNLGILEKANNPSEQDVKRLIVEPIMLWTGIDVYDPNSLREEFTIRQVKSPTKADYAVLVDGSPKIAVEVKNLKEKLDDNLKQLIDYCNFGNIRFGLITNGKDWWFVDETWKNSSERVFLRVNLNSEYSKLLKLVNPYFFDILEHTASELKKIEKSDLENKEMFKRVTLEDAMNKLNVQKAQFNQKEYLDIDGQNVRNRFVNLSDFLEYIFNQSYYRYVEGIKPPEIVIVNNKEIKVTYWKDIFVKFIELSYKKLKIPFKMSDSDRRFVINTEKYHSNGKKMFSPYEIKSDGQVIYVETNYSVASFFKIFKKIKKIAQLPDDYIEFPSDWFKETKKYVEEKKDKNVRS